MKTFLLLIIFFTGSICFAGSNNDSLHRVAYGNFPDSSRINALHALSKLTKNRDSALSFAYQALDLAKKSDFESGKVVSLKRLGDIFFDVNNYPKALDYLLLALQGYEEVKDSAGMMNILSQLGNVYTRQSDYKTALQYFRGSANIRRLTGHDERIIFFGIGKAHEGSEQLDSALIYYQRAYEYFQSQPSSNRTPFVLIHLGNVHLKKKNNLLALSYARMAGEHLRHVTDSSGISSIYTHIAEIFYKTGSRDSAIFYAQKAFNIGVRNNFDDAKLDPALLLAEMYSNDPAKAYYYLKIGKSIQDTMFSRDKMNEVQNISLNEKERVRELALKEEKEKLERKNNIQYAGIGLGLALFGLLFILLSSSIIVNEKHVKFLGILILLMVFEFLNLVLHPYIGEITHHSPVLMLLAMVAIAALLIPSHHHLEHWITQKMVKKNKRVRLTAAKKIVEELEKEVS